MDGVGDLIDLDRYPLGERGSKRYDAFIETCRAMHDEQGACNLQGFIRPEAIEKLRHEADTLLPVGYDKVFTRNVYFTDDDPSLPADHPVRQFWTFSSNQVADDQIDDETLIRQIYLWQPLVDFIADVESCATLYPMADEFQALNIIALEEGGGSPWHYDTNAFTVTLLLEAPEGGGDFVYAPDIRTKDNPNYDGVKRVLDGDKSLIRQLPR
ncbi:MAG: hypothetical protein HOI34_01845, partial [Rhodospirillaceae bacterium]|nr:hypothetical protein [Rhodospirillaceae bacterium]